MSDFSPHVDTSDTPGWCRTVTAALHRQWERYGQTGLQLAIGLMTIAALWRLGHELPRLVWEQGGPGAVDLRARHAEVQHWFAGQPVYGAVEDRDYPPASYTMLWPSLGWLDVAPARGLGAASTLVALGWLSYLCVRESRAQTRTEYGFIGLLAFAAYAASAGIRVGQLTPYVMPILVASLVWLSPHERLVPWTLLPGALCFVLSLVKATLSAPFFWLVWCVSGCWSALFLIGGGYAALTLLAAAFQHRSPVGLLQAWLHQAQLQSGTKGYANLHT